VIGGSGGSGSAKPLTATSLSIDTTKVSAGSSAANQFKLPLVSTGAYSFRVNWGDGNTDLITVWNQAQVTHTYAVAGAKTVTLTGLCYGFQFANTGDRLKLLDILAFGTALRLGDTGSCLQGCANLTTISAPDALITAGETTFFQTFGNCTKLVSILSFLLWDTSQIATPNFMFQGCTLLNQDLSNLNTQSFVRLKGMFNECPAFNRDLSKWDLRSANNLEQMFQTVAGSTFNNGANTNINPITGRAGMNGWNVSGVLRTVQMFFGCAAFNRDLGDWNVGACITLFRMFLGCSTFNQDLSKWDVSNAQFDSVTSTDGIGGIFQSCTAFNNGANTNVNPLTGRAGINGWNISKCGSLFQVFLNCAAFNRDISSWDTANIADMFSTFRGATIFNQNISGWNVEKVASFSGTFQTAIAFKKDLGAWWPKAATTMANMFNGVDMNAPNSAANQTNYNNLLKGWTGWSGGAGGSPSAKGLALQNNVPFHGGTSKYSLLDADAVAARNWLITVKGWTIIDGGGV
jgi:surface protein